MKTVPTLKNSRPGNSEGEVVSRSDPWEAAYLTFETADQEIHKFRTRLKKMGADQWPRDAETVELFCGRGNGLRALTEFGFTRVEGVDLSESLLAEYEGPGKCYVADCRKLPFADQSKDIVVIQGGLHHLQSLPEDLNQTLSEVSRILRKKGRVAIVEPWLTPFLSFTHAVCRSQVARRFSRKVDALATMIYYERETYEQWLYQPQVVLTLLNRHFLCHKEAVGWGKLRYVGEKR